MVCPVVAYVILYYIYINYQKENCLFDLHKFFHDNVVGVLFLVFFLQFSIISPMKNVVIQI